MDIGFFTTYTEQEVLERMDTYANELIKKRGVKLDGFLLDDAGMTALENGCSAQPSTQVLAR